MRGTVPVRRLAKQSLPAMVLLAALVGVPLALSAQQTAPEQARASSSASSAADPWFHANPENVGDLKLAKRHYQAAIEAYQKVPHASAVLWNKMGIAYQMMFDEKDAARCYQESLKLDPRDARVLNNLGTVYDAEKNYSKAEHMYRKALKINPKSAVSTLNLGTNLMVQGEYDEGWKMYQRAITLNPDILHQSSYSVAWNTMTPKESGAIHYYQAKGYAQAGMTDKALRSLRRALNEGFTSPKKISRDSSFSPLHGNPKFEQMMAEREKE